MKNKIIKKALCFTLLFSTIFSTLSPTTNVFADETVDSVSTSEVGYLGQEKDLLFRNFQVLLGFEMIHGTFNYALDEARALYKYVKNYINNYINIKYKGYKPLREAKIELEKICNNSSQIKVYGQDKAKRQMLPVVMNTLYNVEHMNKGDILGREKIGNVIYMIGPSGVGKTTMAKAIAAAILKHPEKTSILIDTSAINSRYPLADQLFKTIEVKNVGKDKRLLSEYDNGVNTTEEECIVLDHIMHWYEAVVIIDDYDKMKRLSNKDSFIENPHDLYDEFACRKDDKSADEVMKSISDTGKYRVSNTEIDCSKTLFIITTNESREELESNFGIDGQKGGGAQRLNIIEFSYLSLEDCKKIVKETIEETKKELTDQMGDFKIKDFYMDEENIDKISKCIFEDKISQGRLKRILRREILSLFTANIGNEEGKQFRVTFEESPDTNFGRFIKIEV